MQKVKLPVTIDPLRAAQKRLDYQGVYTPAQLARFATAVVGINEDAQCFLSFAIDSQRLVVIKGKVQAQVTLRCQRCEQPFDYLLSSRFCFSPVTDEQQIERLPAAYEAVEMNSFGEIDLLAMVEDEMIISLPVAPKHDPEHCEVSVVQTVFGTLPEQPASPFGVLASLKRK